MPTATQSAGERIVAEVTSWPGVEAVDGSRGELSLRLGKREIGHLHGDHALHLGFPKKLWHELHEQGRIDYHPVFPGKPGYAARRIADEDDVRDVIELLRLNYDRAIAKHGLP
ncbi:MAG: DUF5519 family protein [Actinomycetota bacterium]|nr:DUF5519 family protein [Actinomycetota bacterium]